MGIRIFHADAASYGFLSSVIATETIAEALLNAGYDRIQFRNLVVSAGALACGCAAAALSPDYGFFSASPVSPGLQPCFSPMPRIACNSAGNARAGYAMRGL